MGPLGPAELVLILVVLLVIFGPGKLPQVGQAIGRAIRELRHASNEVEDSSGADSAASRLEDRRE
jgi:sec-independent protein translocase protein TatA